MWLLERVPDPGFLPGGPASIHVCSQRSPWLALGPCSPPADLGVWGPESLLLLLRKEERTEALLPHGVTPCALRLCPLCSVLFEAHVGRCL